MQKRTVVDQIEIKPDGTVHLQFVKCLIEDDGTVTRVGDHRRTLNPNGEDIDAQIAAMNADLVNNHKCAAVLVSEIDEYIKPHVKMAHTPTRIAAHKAKIAADLAKVVYTK